MEEMRGIWLVSYVALWSLTFFELLLIALLIRQVGILGIRLRQLSQGSSLPTVEVGEQVSDFVGTNLEGQEIRFSELVGKNRKAVTIFVDLYCQSCLKFNSSLAENLSLNRWSDDYQLVVGSNGDRKSNERHFQKIASKASILIGTSYQAAQLLASHKAPWAMILDGHRNIVAHSRVTSYTDLQRLIQQLKEEQNV